MENQERIESMLVAYEARGRADCCGRLTGAAVFVDSKLVCVGWNGTVHGPLCTDGGCYRCANKDEYVEGSYGDCVCIHAEELAVSIAARLGESILGGAMYCTLKPCVNCMRLMIAAGITEVHYHVDWKFGSNVPVEIGLQYLSMASSFTVFQRLELP